MVQSYQESKFKVRDGSELFFRFREGQDKDNALIIVHGFGEHSGRYENLANDLQLKDLSIFAIDLRGHGKSDGQRGDACSLDVYCEDLKDFLALLNEKFNIKRPVMLGHSLGGLIAIRFAEKYGKVSGLKALAVTCPALGVVMTPLMKIKRIVAFVLSRLVPKIRLSVGLNINMLSRDKGVVKSYVEDPLVHGKMSARMALSVLLTGPEVIRNASLLDIPVFIGQGESDQIANPKLTEEFYHQLKTTDITYHTYPGLYHEIFNELEPDRSTVVTDFKNWLQRVLV